MYLSMVDYLSFSVDIYDYTQDAICQGILERLEEKKKQSTNTGLREDVENATIDISGWAFEVLGNGSRGYAYILHNDEYEIRIAKYRSDNEDMYPIFVRIKQDGLWSNTPQGAYKGVIAWIGFTFGCVKAVKISRADLCCHTDQFQFTQDDIDRFRGKHRKETIRRCDKKVVGFELGERTSPVFLRIYNKTKEVMEKGQKLWFFTVWGNEGADVSNVWNIEFELKRDFFKEIQVETVDQFFERLRDIWLYLTTDWIEFVDFNNNHISRCSVNEKWVALSKTYDTECSRGRIKRDRQTSIDSKNLIPQISGYMTKFGAMLKENDIGNVFKLAIESVKDYFDQKGITFTDRANEKMELMMLKLVGDEI